MSMNHAGLFCQCIQAITALHDHSVTTRQRRLPFWPSDIPQFHHLIVLQELVLQYPGVLYCTLIDSQGQAGEIKDTAA